MRRRAALGVVLCLLASLAWPVAPASADPGDRFPTNGDFIDQSYRDVLGREPDAGGLAHWQSALSTRANRPSLVDSLIHSSEYGDLIAPVIRLYYAAFGHDPDTGGFSYWLGRRRGGLTAEGVAQAFTGTPEFGSRYGGTTNAQLVDRVYQNVLGRTPDASGRAYWIGQLDRGAARSVVLLAISESPEHKSRRRGEVEVHQAYFAMLRRVAEPSGSAYWSERIRSGFSTQSLIGVLYETPEYAARFRRTPTLAITMAVGGLTFPWGLAFAPDGTMLFTERGGAIGVRLTDGTTRTLSAQLGDLFVNSEAGLMDLALDTDFASNRRFYTCQAHTSPNDVRVIAWTVDAGWTTATRVADPLLAGLPLTSGRHAGCRLSSGTDGSLLIATGDAAVGTNAQDLGSLGGKVLRVSDTTGAGLPGNPFAGSANANTRRILSYGHRNLQGLAYRSNGQLWTAEHGTDCDDEINLHLIGANYGWDPVPGYNESRPMTDLQKFPGAVPAAWSSGCPTIATSGITFLRGAQWGAWEGHLAVAALKGQSLRVMSFTSSALHLGQVAPAPLDQAFGRLRTVVEGPDGSLYVLTSNGGGDDRILKVVPSVPQ